MFASMEMNKKTGIPTRLNSTMGTREDARPWRFSESSTWGGLSEGRRKTIYDLRSIRRMLPEAENHGLPGEPLFT